MNIIRGVTGPHFVKISPDSFLKFLSASATNYFGGRGLTGLLEDACLGKEAVQGKTEGSVKPPASAHFTVFYLFRSYPQKCASVHRRLKPVTAEFMRTLDIFNCSLKLIVLLNPLLEQKLLDSRLYPSRACREVVCALA